MTTIAAIVCPSLKLAAIGSDGQVTVGDQIAKLNARKFSTINGIGFAFAGYAIAGKAAERLFRNIAAETSEPEDVLMRFQKRIEQFDDPVLTKGASGIVAWPSGLYYVSTTDGPLEVGAAVGGLHVAATGSGGTYALGALHAMAMDLDGKVACAADLTRMLTTAIHMGIFYDRNSGGVPVTELLDGNAEASVG